MQCFLIFPYSLIIHEETHSTTQILYNKTESKCNLETEKKDSTEF
jgi:hypothetical protein